MREILHISDIHFGPHYLPEVGQGVLDLIERRMPHLVVVSGDITQRAKPRQFQEARTFIDSIRVPTLVVPGNHDVPMYRVWERVLVPYRAYQKYFADDMEPVFEDDELVAIGVNTAFNWTIKDGRITAAARRRLSDLLARFPAGKAKIVVAHHQLVPPPRFDSQKVLAGAYKAAGVLSRSQVDLVLSGHLHQTWIGDTEAYYPSRRWPVLLLHSGTTTSGRGRGKEKRRNTCNWVRIHDHEIEITHLLWDQGSGAFSPQSRHMFPRRSHQPVSW